jgi:hypothetical protein
MGIEADNKPTAGVAPSTGGGAQTLTTPNRIRGPRRIKLTDLLLAALALTLILGAIALWITGVVAKN